MDSSLHEVWQAASGNPFHPSISKDSQFYISFLLLLFGIAVTGVFALNRSFASVIALGIPASLAIAFGVVYMFCAVGVYV
ncbi:Putative DNA repair protein [[Torrubiella] hemipterigena]|uniref:Dolichyl-diphosphooligosaccharide-protein glycosyltransferase subunit OST5 n=1 Tax=[Torrubiella] hemipterigena TaxID=1531966 RepID=A0A0A1TED1_9HYPO|nr:Putative DNA repair protein [[Torrubiella] hemipterigena]